MVGDLAVSAARTGSAALCLVVTEPNGRSRRVNPPAKDLLPGVTIDATLDARRVKLGISAPKEIRIQRSGTATYGRH